MRLKLIPVFLTLVLAACAPTGTPEPTSVPQPSDTAVLPTATLLPPTDTPTPLPPTPTSGPVFPDPNLYQWKTVVSGLELPVDIQNAGDERLFVVERTGRIRIVKENFLSDIPFLDIRRQVGSGSSEQGLLGLAFHPRYAENGFFFVNYTDRNGNTVISRFQVSAEDPDQADPASELRLLDVEQPYPNHNGGGMVFGPDGYLYIGLGDGGSGGDPQGFGQSPNTVLGKILRIDVDNGSPYGIPADNPYAGGGGFPEIWATGLRNPWRFAFDSLTGDLYIGDVGQNAWEEIDFLPAGSPPGANFGWKFFEGSHPYIGEPPSGLELIMPAWEYDHGLGCSVTGGVVYRGEDFPSWQGIYLFGDYCSGRIWGLARNGVGSDSEWSLLTLFDTSFTLSTFGVDMNGEVYLTDYRAGTIYRLGER